MYNNKKDFIRRGFPCSIASRNAFPVHSGTGPSGQTDATETITFSSTEGVTTAAKNVEQERSDQDPLNQENTIHQKRNAVSVVCHCV